MRTHGGLHVETFVEPMFGENAYLLWTDDGPAAWVIDPGLAPHEEDICAAVARRKLEPAAVLVTHAHPDHIAGIAGLKQTWPAMQVIAPRDEAAMLGDARANLSAIMGLDVTAPPADQLVGPGDRLTLGTLEFEVLDVAGHSPGGLAFLCRDAGVVFTGDALFAGSIGRVDFPGGSLRKLTDNIRRHLFALPDETVVYSGHGPPTTIDAERETNPWLRGG